MADELDYLEATLRNLDAERRGEVERELSEPAREALLGTLLPDVAHDIANALFAVLGLTDLMLADATPGSKDAERLDLVRQTGLDLKATLGVVLDFARALPNGPDDADLVEATRSALALVRHGRGKHVEIVERLPHEPVRVRCDARTLGQAALHLLVAARDQGRIDVEVTPDGGLHVEPASADSLGALVVARIAADRGGTFEAGLLRLPLAGTPSGDAV